MVIFLVRMGRLFGSMRWRIDYIVLLKILLCKAQGVCAVRYRVAGVRSTKKAQLRAFSETTIAGCYCVLTIKSTRRFNARPASVELVAIGEVSPIPTGMRLLPFTPLETRYSTTDSERS
jgi:hypothetical protein